MRFSVLASGSRANCTFVEHGETRILIDCGLSAKQTEIRLASLGVSPGTISAIVLTHEHSDHLAGIPVFSRKHGIPVYTNLGSLPGAFAVRRFERSAGFLVGELTFHPFSISHDAQDPVGFRIEAGGAALGYATDLGYVSGLVQTMLRGVDALILEANHDLELLDRCRYPWTVKRRIASDTGHLSNCVAAGLVDQLLHPGLKSIVLAHLSEESNTPETALDTVQRALPSTYTGNLRCAGREFSLPLFELGSPPVGLDERSSPSTAAAA